MSRINFLPPWVETNCQPAFYDKESGTALQQTARMYAKVNQLIRSVNEQNETIADYIQQFIDLKDYVDDYFENLDVQEEIDHKLDEMAEDGTITALIKGYVDPFIEEQNHQISEQNTTIDNFVINSTKDIAEIDSKVNSAVSGSPKAVYATLSDLETDDPDHDYIYVVTADGHWYYYDTANSQWSDGGVYQSSGVSPDFVKLQNDFYGARPINEHDLLADSTLSSLTSLDAQTTITDSDNSPSRQINISNLDGSLSGASLDLGTLFNPITTGTYYFSFKVKYSRNSASAYQAPAILFYYYLGTSLKGSKTALLDSTIRDEWQEVTFSMSLTQGEVSPFNKFHIYCNTKYDYEVKDLYIVNDEDYLTGYCEYFDGVYTVNNKKISIIGDSISASGFNATVKYTDLLNSVDGYIIDNQAVSGAGYFNGSNYHGTNDHQFYNQALRCDRDSDLYLVFGGFNDISKLYNGDVTLGQLGDTGTDTIYGCIYNTFNNIYTLNPLAKIGLVLPNPWQGYNSLMADNNPYKVHVEGFLNALITSAEHYSVQLMDLFHNSGLRPWNADVRTALYYESDGTHPNNTGHAEYIYPHMKEFVRSFINYKYIS